MPFGAAFKIHTLQSTAVNGKAADADTAGVSGVNISITT